MESLMNIADPPAHTPNGGFLPNSICFCPTCNKPFASGTSRDRHIRYCGTRTRSRPRSCRACNAAKTKCSVELPCSRCMTKAIECIYDKSIAVGERTRRRSSGPVHEMRAELHGRASSLNADKVLNANNDDLSERRYIFADDQAVQNDMQLQLVATSGLELSPALRTYRSSSNEFLSNQSSLAFHEKPSDQHQSIAEISTVLFDKFGKGPETWCSWIRPGFSLSVVTEQPTLQTNSNLLTIFQMERPRAQNNADKIIQSLRSFPLMMQRRETFPWFIHPHAHLLSQSAAEGLPEPLSTCMSIAQMFGSRTSITKRFIWRTIRTEHCRLVDEMYSFSQSELLAALQACMIYLIMHIVDYSEENEFDGLELLSALYDLTGYFKLLVQRPCTKDETSSPCLNWRDWIFAESERRLSNLWFLIGCVVCVKTGTKCDPSQTYRDILLPSPKALWEAATQPVWASEYEMNRIFQMSGLKTLGDLVDAQRSDFTPSNIQKLDTWNAGVDNLGSLLNLVVNMV